ncbi:MAG TPA: hypothetical protein VK539_18230 [Myxococcaceae bacterium]|nr:hypothetical protein [Myxococcaceae bacterium]
MSRGQNASHDGSALLERLETRSRKCFERQLAPGDLEALLTQRLEGLGPGLGGGLVISLWPRRKVRLGLRQFTRLDEQWRYGLGKGARSRRDDMRRTWVRSALEGVGLAYHPLNERART